MHFAALGPHSGQKGAPLRFFRETLAGHLVGDGTLMAI